MAVSTIHPSIQAHGSHFVFSLLRFAHDNVIKWKHFPRHWPFVRGIHRSPVNSPVNSPHKGQWRGALMFSLICTWMNGWVNNREAGDLRRHRAHYDVIVMRRFYLCQLTGLGEVIHWPWFQCNSLEEYTYIIVKWCTNLLTQMVTGTSFAIWIV